MEDAFSILPSDCWELIFNRIDDFEAISLVCKDFLSLSNSLQYHLNVYYHSIKLLSRFLKRFRYLKSIDLSDLHAADINQILLEVARSGLNLESLNVSQNDKSWIESLTELGSNMKSLKKLDCSDIITKDSDLTAIASSLPWLEKIVINNYWNDDASVSDDGIEMLTKRLPNLQKIDICGNHKLTERSLIALSYNCPFLKKIRVHRYDRSINLDSLGHVFRQCTNLVSVTVGGFSTSSSPSRFTIENSIAFAKNLRELNFHYQIITDRILFAIASARLPLKTFSLDTCQDWSVLGLSELLREHQSLINLQIVGANILDDEDMSGLFKYIRNLTYIRLKSCRNLTSYTLFNLLKSCPLLVTINMKNTGLGEEFEKIEDLGIDLSINYHVQYLRVSRNRYLHDELLEKIGLTCPNLVLLNVTGMSDVTNDGIVEVLKRCNKITHLYRDTKNFRTNLELFTSNMEVLKITGVDDEEMEMIAERCPRLSKLNVCYSRNLTDKGVMAVVENCVKLREINLRDCTKVSLDILPLMVSTRPSLLKICPPDNKFVPTEDQKDLFVFDQFGYLIVTNNFGRRE